MRYFLARHARFRSIVASFVCCCRAVAVSMLVLTASSAFPAEKALQEAKSVAPASTDDEETVERYRRVALAKLALGRDREKEERYDDALRLYYRARLFDRSSPAIARAAIELALKLNREAEAARHAILAVQENVPLDADLLRQLGSYLMEQGEWETAAVLMQKALDSNSGNKKSATDLLDRMELGKILGMAGKNEKAADCFAVVMKALLDPKSDALDETTRVILLGERPAAVYSLFGDCFIEAGRPAEARTAFDKANELQPDPTARKLNEARTLLVEKKPAEALAILDKLLAEKISGQGETPYEAFADALKQLNKSDETIPRLEELLKKNPEDLALLYSLGERCAEAKKYDRARELFEETTKLAPTLTGYRKLIDVFRKSGDYDALLKALGEATAIGGGVESLADEVQDISEDEKASEGLVAAAKKNLSAAKASDYERLAVAAAAALEGKRWSDAETLFNAAVKADPSRAAEAYLVWGLGLLVGEKGKEAVTVFEKAILAADTPAAAALFQFYLAGALGIDGRYDEALAATEKAVKLRPDLSRLRERKCWVLLRAKRYADARKAYEQLIQDMDKDFSSDEVRETVKQAKLALSSLCEELKDTDAAEELLENVWGEFPDDVGAMNDLGYLWADHGKNLGLAEKMIRQAMEKEPKSAAYRDSLAWALYRQGRFDDALVESKKAADELDDGVIFEHQGDIYKALGKMDEAKNAWAKSAKAFRKAGEPDKAVAVEKKSQPSP